jgi:hypothetical protein
VRLDPRLALASTADSRYPTRVRGYRSTPATRNQP